MKSIDDELRILERLIKSGDAVDLARYIHAYHRTGRDHPLISSINVGTDWSSGGANRSPEGYHYGITSANNLADWFWDIPEPIYIPHCPSCSAELNEDEIPEICACGAEIDEEEVYGAEIDETIINEEGVKGHVGSGLDVWITESPYYMRGFFCSPCASGAVDLSAPTIDGPKAYCPPHDWYEEGKAPHLIFKVSDNTIVYPSKD
jgi:hypothetical protein